MEDKDILELYFARSQDAIPESRKKYGRYTKSIAMRILNNSEDAEEAENDSYLKAWNTIPPKRPQNLLAYFGMLVRSVSIDRLKKMKAGKRAGDEYTSSLDELYEVTGDSSEEIADTLALRDALNVFLESLEIKERKIFMQRYWWVRGIKEIANEFSMSDGAVKMLLRRTRVKLCEYLKKEGFSV